MSSYCECCEFDAPNHSRYLKHLGTRKHAKRYLDAIKHLENPNQNIVFSQSSKEKVQETEINEFKKKSQNYTQNTDLEESVQEYTDFVFLDAQILDLYKTISTPLNPTFSWIMWIFMSINAFFHPFQKNTEEKDLSGNE